MPERVLLTGATGFIGRHLVERLLRDGHRVTAMVHETPLPDVDSRSGLSTIRADVTDYETMTQIGEHDLIVHLAGAVSVASALENPRDAFDVNTAGVQNVLERARADGVEAFVYASSAAVYGPPDQLPVSERSAVAPNHPYAGSKLAGEHLVESYSRAYGIDAATVRPFTTYGPGQPADSLVAEILRQATAGASEIRLGNLYPTRDFVYVEDVVDGIAAVIDALDESYEVYNIGSETEHSIAEVVEYVLDLTDSEADIVSRDGRSDAVEIERIVADCTKLRATGWSPQFDLRDGLEETLETYHHERY